MCMDVQTSEKMGDRNNVDEDIQILEARIDKGSLKAPVKQERPDEAEIRELAAKMVEANKAKANSTAAQAAAAAALMPPRPPGAGNQQLSGLLGYFNNRRSTPEVNNITKCSSPEVGKVTLDDESLRGHFGWTSFGDTHIPYIFRGSEKYCAVRILESKLLNKYLSYLHSDIYSCTCIRSYYITEAESRLLNEINNRHCENQFGRDQFTCKDLVVRLADAKEFYTFLDVCYTKLTAGSSQNALAIHNKPDKCGFIRINKESVVPYTVKDGLKYVPLFYFEGETDNLKLKAEKLEGWDLSYLKFCCKVQGIRNELFASETCSVISLNDIKSYFPPGTGFEDYWPSKVMDSQLLVNCKGSGSGGGWTKQPPAPPVTKAVHTNIISKNAINAKGAALQNMLPRNSLPVSSLQRVNQRPIVTAHQVHPSSPVVSSVRTNQISQPMMNAVQATVNGWSGLVGGQPTFPSPLVSQANSIIRMAPANLTMHSLSAANKSYAQQQVARSRGTPVTSQPYPVYSNTTMQTAVPPLIRTTVHSSQPNLGYPTYGKGDWVSTTYSTPSLVSNPATGSTYPQMLGFSAEQVQALMPPQATSTASLMSRHTPPVLNTAPTAPPAHSTPTTPKYPPPLIPVNGNSNNNRDSRGRKPLIPIAETHSSMNCTVQPYQVQKALVEDKLVPCINFKPYIYSELLMTLPDFVAQYFPNCDVESCRQVLTEVLMVDLYQGNRLQMEMLMKNGKCSSLNEELPLIQVRSIMKYMPQLKYMLSNRNMGMPQPAHIQQQQQQQQQQQSSDEHAAKKRQRTS